MIRLILVGLGARGRYWLEVVRRSATCEAVAFCDPDPAARNWAETQSPGIPIFATLDEALGIVQADALVLATPPDTRDEHIARACRDKLPLLVEKPLALDLETATRYTVRAEKANIPLMVGLNFRYLPVTNALKTLFTDDVLGPPESARFTYERRRDPFAPHLNKYPATMTHPMLWEQSVHHLDLLRFVYGREPVSVYCRTTNPAGSPYQGDTNVFALITFEGGLEVNYQGSWQSSWIVPNFEWRTDARGGVALQRDQFGSLSFARRDDPDLTPVDLPPHETWISDTEGVLRAFSRTLLKGAPLECGARDHLGSLALVEACVRSSTLDERAPVREEAVMG